MHESMHAGVHVYASGDILRIMYIYMCVCVGMWWVHIVVVYA